MKSFKEQKFVESIIVSPELLKIQRLRLRLRTFSIHPGHIPFKKHAWAGNQLVIAIAGYSLVSYAYSQQERAEALRLLGIWMQYLMEGNELELIVRHET